MLHTLKLRNFRQHAELDLEFGPGLNVIVGDNERGKTTILEAISYALFGIRACRNSDVCNWAAPVDSHQVALTLTLFGENLSVQRSAKRAVLLVNTADAQYSVTGQQDVTRWFEQRLLPAAGLGGSLMFAAQGDIRGALKAGGSATTALIEKLAGFELIGEVIQAVEAHLPAGSDGWLQERIDRARTQWQQASVAALTDPDLSAYEATILEAERSIHELTAGRPDLLEQVTQLKQVIERRQQHAQAVSELHQRLQRLTMRMESAKHSTEQYRLRAVCEVTPSQLAEAEQVLSQARQHQQWSKAWSAFRAVSQPVAYWPDGLGSLRQHQANTRWNWQQATQRMHLAEGEVRALQGQLVLSNTCQVCGQDVTDNLQIQRKNREIEQLLVAARLTYQAASQEVTSLSAALKQLADVERQDDPGLLADQYPEWIAVSVDSWPRQIQWVGDIPDGDANRAMCVAQQTVQQLRQALASAESAHQECVRLQSQWTTDLQQQQALQIELEQLGPVTLFESEQQALSDLLSRLAHSRELIESNTQLIQQCRDTMWRLADDVTQRRQLVADLAKAMEEDQQLLVKMQHHNGLLKQLRTLKPALANQVWNRVLGAVSQYCTAMRGSPTQVSKSAEGFKVDGKAVESFSGSTLDVLGLAIRIALIRVFLPATPFLLLDEPFSACSEGRQSGALGFLASAGFEQTLLITHEATSAAVADWLVEV